MNNSDAVSRKSDLGVLPSTRVRDTCRQLCESLHVFHKHIICRVLRVPDLMSIKRNAVQICICWGHRRVVCVQ